MSFQNCMMLLRDLPPRPSPKPYFLDPPLQVLPFDPLAYRSLTQFTIFPSIKIDSQVRKKSIAFVPGGDKRGQGEQLTPSLSQITLNRRKIEEKMI